MKTHFLLIEDDPQQSETIKSAIERRFRDVNVQLIETESAFYDQLAKIPEHGEVPSMVICDVMLPWAFPSEKTPTQPPEVAKGSFRKAGLRCWERFRKREDLRSIPWIYFTVLDEKTIDLKTNSDEKTGYAQKAGSIEPLFVEIEELQSLDQIETSEEVSTKLLASPKMRKILVDGINTPLDDCTTSLR